MKKKAIRKKKTSLVTRSLIITLTLDWSVNL